METTATTIKSKKKLMWMNNEISSLHTFSPESFTSDGKQYLGAIGCTQCLGFFNDPMNFTHNMEAHNHLVSKCKEEARKVGCRQESIAARFSMNFITELSLRYGWNPLPYYVEEEEEKKRNTS